MRKVVTVVVILCCLVQVACKKKSTTPKGYSVQPDNNRDSLVSLTAKVNGTLWHTDSAYAYKVRYAGDTTKADLYITATQKASDGTSTMAFTIINYTGPKIYNINPPINAASYYAGNVRHYGISGKITVLTDTNYAITGTFDFLADTTSITEGVFNVAKP